MTRFIVIVVLGLLYLHSGLAQEIIDPGAIQILRDVENSKDLQIYNHTNTTLVISIYSQYDSKTNNLVFEIRSQPVYLKPGINRFNLNLLQEKGIQTGPNDLNSFISQSNGNYQVCIAAVSFENNLHLSSHCFDVGPFGSQGSNKKARQPYSYSASGEVTMEQFLSGQQDGLPVASQSYTQFYGSTEINILQLPLTGQFRYSTENNLYQTTPNSITFSFDSDQFKNNITNKLRHRLLQLKEDERIQQAEDIAKLADLENLDTLLTDSLIEAHSSRLMVLRQRVNDLQGKKDSIYQLRELSSQIQDSLGNWGSKKADTLEVFLGQINDWESELKALEKKQPEIQKLKERKEQLIQMRQQLEQTGKLPHWYKENLDIHNPDQILSKAEDLGGISKAEKFLLAIDEIQLGSLNPTFSPLILQGIPINGTLLSISPGNWYATAFMGKTGPIPNFMNGISLDSLGFDKNEDQYRLTGTRFGLGHPSGTHCHLMLLQEQNIHHSPETSAAPQPNQQFVGIDWKTSLLSDHMTIQNQIAYKQPPKEIRDPASNYLACLTDLWLRSKGDRSSLNLSLRTIGSDYSAVGAPFLRKSSKSFSSQAEQTLFRRRIKMSALYRVDQFEGTQDTLVKSMLNQWSLGIKYMSKKLPSIQVRLMQLQQSTISRITQSNHWQLVSNKSYQTGARKASTMLLYSFIENSNDQTGLKAHFHQARLSQYVTSTDKLSYSLSGMCLIQQSIIKEQVHHSATPFDIDYFYLSSNTRQQWTLDASVAYDVNYAISSNLSIQYFNNLINAGFGVRVETRWNISKTFTAQFRAQVSDLNRFMEVSIRSSW